MLLEGQVEARGLQPNDGAGSCSIVVRNALTLLVSLHSELSQLAERSGWNELLAVSCIGHHEQELRLSGPPTNYGLSRWQVLQWTCATKKYCQRDGQHCECAQSATRRATQAPRASDPRAETER